MLTLGVWGEGEYEMCSSCNSWLRTYINWQLGIDSSVTPIKSWSLGPIRAKVKDFRILQRRVQTLNFPDRETEHRKKKKLKRSVAPKKAQRNGWWAGLLWFLTMKPSESKVLSLSLSLKVPYKSANTRLERKLRFVVVAQSQNPVWFTRNWLERLLLLLWLLFLL